ncbi:Proton-dependent oligopeptide transporter family, partial [Corchorus capsularis]
MRRRDTKGMGRKNEPEIEAIATALFHMKSITAATIINIFHGTSNLASLLGAFLSDTFFGRCKTLAFASIASFL